MRELPMQDDSSMERLRKEATTKEKRIQETVQKPKPDEKKTEGKKD